MNNKTVKIISINPNNKYELELNYGLTTNKKRGLFYKKLEILPENLHYVLGKLRKSGFNILDGPNDNPISSFDNIKNNNHYEYKNGMDLDMKRNGYNNSFNQKYLKR